MTWNPADVKPVDLAARIAGMPEADPPHRTFWGHAASASCVAYSPDGSLIASAGHDNVVNIWDTGRDGSPKWGNPEAGWASDLLGSGALTCGGKRELVVKSRFLARSESLARMRWGDETDV